MGSLRESDCAHLPHMPSLPVSLDMLFIPHSDSTKDMIRKGEDDDTLFCESRREDIGGISFICESSGRDIIFWRLMLLLFTLSAVSLKQPLFDVTQAKKGRLLFCYFLASLQKVNETVVVDDASLFPSSQLLSFHIGSFRRESEDASDASP